MSIDVPHPHVETVLRGMSNGEERPSRNDAPRIDWQPVLGELISFAHAWHRESVQSQRWATTGVFVLVGIVMVGATLLGWKGIIGGQALAALFGAGAGFLLARTARAF